MIPFVFFRIRRNFVNKLWNVGKFIQNCLSTSTDLEFSSKNFVSDTDLKCLSLSEKFIISKCHSLVKQVTLLLENYDFSDAGRAIYDFLWDDFADWYIEASKIKLKNGNEMDRQNVGRVLVYVWDTCLKLLHPFMPYLTEVLWQNIPHQGESLMIAQWPLMQSRDALIVDSTAVDSFIKLQSTVRAIRNIRAEYNVDVNKKLEVILRINSAMRDIFEQEKDVFCALSKVEKMVILDNYTKETDTVHVVVEDGLEVFIPQTGLVDKEKEVARLSKQSKNLRKDIAVLEGRLNNPGFRDKAPKELVDDASKNLKELKEQLKVIDASLNLLVL